MIDPFSCPRPTDVGEAVEGKELTAAQKKKLKKKQKEKEKKVSWGGECGEEAAEEKAKGEGEEGALGGVG